MIPTQTFSEMRILSPLPAFAIEKELAILLTVNFQVIKHKLLKNNFLDK